MHPFIPPSLFVHLAHHVERMGKAIAKASLRWYWRSDVVTKFAVMPFVIFAVGFGANHLGVPTVLGHQFMAVTGVALFALMAVAAVIHGPHGRKEK